MKNTSLKDLLKILMYGKITPEDLHALKESATNSSEKELNDKIQSIWDETDEVNPMDKEIKAKVLTNIHKQIDISTRKTAFSWIRIAAVILIPVLISLSSYVYFSNRYKTVPEEFIVMAESGQKTKIHLPDGTFVWLNSDSKLSYSSDFNQNNRTVRLEGEAFFEVDKNTDINFTVETEKVNVVVHGTAFNVSAYKEDATINISLLRGKVALESVINHTLLAELSPGHVASVSREDMTYSITPCDAEMESLWTRNILKFENTPAADVFRKLARWYGVEISIENMNENIYYGFTLKSESLREIFDEINKITPIKYKINGEEVNISYR